MSVLVVDAANVVGSVPDGWWRDRPGAARRLHDRLVAAELPHERVVLVVEGAARTGPPEDSPLEVVRATGSGDDAVVDVVRRLRDDGQEVVVVTADRGLRARVTALGAAVQGPSTLR